MNEVLRQLSETLPWLTLERGEIGDHRFREEYSIPTDSVFFQPAPNRVLVVFSEDNSNWTVITFNTNSFFDLFFSSRVTKPRAPIAVAALVLAEMLDCMNTNLKALEENFPEGKEAIAKLTAEINSVELAIKSENAIPSEAQRVKLSDFLD